MTLLDWSQALELGVSEIDRQHKMLVDAMNELNDHILRGKEKDGCLIGAARMRKYALEHFSDEEALMRKSDFPHLARHQKKHREFIKKTTEFSDANCKSNPEKSLEMLTFLQEWLVDHILGPDFIFASHYKAWEASR